MPPPPHTPGTLPPVIGFILATALAIVSLGVHAASDEPVIALPALRAAVARTGGQGPVILVNARHEEAVWWANGELSLKPPWMDVEAERWVAVADDPGALPDDGSERVGAIMVEPPWAARRVGEESGTLDVFTLLDRAEVRVVKASGEARRCSTWRTGQWFCGPNPWNFVGPNDLVIDGERRRCLWMHPHEEGVLEVQFSDLPSGWRFVGRLALSDEAAATPGGVPVDVEVDVDGRQVLTHRQANARGWRDVEVALDPPKGGAEAPAHHTLTFKVHAAGTGRRHLCMVGALVDRPEAGGP